MVSDYQVAMEQRKNAKPVFFWSDDYKPQDQPCWDAEGPLRQPESFAHEAAAVLRTPEHKIGYRGMALCRICNQGLGSNDFIGYGFVWPQRAEHYVLIHRIITPELLQLVIAYRSMNWKREGL